MQAGIIACIIGFIFRNTPDTAATSWWPYALFAYASAAAVLPWLTGGYVEGELSIVISAVYGVLFALPMWAASRWLADSPYHLIATGTRVLVGFWALHFLIALVLWIRNRVRADPAHT